MARIMRSILCWLWLSLCAGLPVSAQDFPAGKLAAIDPATLSTPEQAARADALARWQMVSPPASGRWLLVNIPAYEISLYDGPRRLGRWKAIVGKGKTPTPEFTGKVTAVVLNPWWEVPRSIVIESVGRMMARQPSRAAREGYVREGDHVRQRPGPDNQLGLVKLEFINPYSVGIHDTPSRSLFGRDKRALSHGCIRVDQPFTLAGALLDMAPEALAATTPGDTQRLALATAVPVIVGYFLAEVDDDGRLRLFDDVYKRRRDPREGC